MMAEKATIVAKKSRFNFDVDTESINSLLDRFDIGGELKDRFNNLFDTIADNPKLKELGEGLKAGIMVGVAAVDLLNTNFNQMMENKKAKLDASHSAELAQIEASTASEKVKQARRAQAEKLYEKKSNAIKKRQAQRDKRMAIFNALINTAAGIAEAIPSIPMMLMAGIIGAAQVASISATPIPMANGGILSGPTNILAGEYMGARNNPEIIAPLDKLKTFIGDTNINLQGAFRLNRK